MNSFFDDEYSIEETKDFNERGESIFPAGQWDAAVFALHWSCNVTPLSTPTESTAANG